MSAQQGGGRQLRRHVGNLVHVTPSPHQAFCQGNNPGAAKPPISAASLKLFASTLITRQHGPHEADSPQVHRRQGPPQAAGHQGSTQVRPRHRRRQEATQVCHLLLRRRGSCRVGPPSSSQPGFGLLVLNRCETKVFQCACAIPALVYSFKACGEVGKSLLPVPGVLWWPARFPDADVLTWSKPQSGRRTFADIDALQRLCRTGTAQVPWRCARSASTRRAQSC